MSNSTTTPVVRPITGDPARDAHFALLVTPDHCACLWCEEQREAGQFPSAGSPAARRPFND